MYVFMYYFSLQDRSGMSIRQQFPDNPFVVPLIAACAF
jgi:hypothetical protein